jgi:hypothetical protein
MKTMAKLNALKAQIESWCVEARAAQKPERVREATDKAKALRAEMSALISEGAEACPHCGQLPHGMEHPSGFEVGCLSCKPFQHTDGTMREHRVKGALLPRHAVEAWNEGPDAWRKA